MRRQWLVLLVAITFSALLWGCGSSGGSGGSDVTDTDRGTDANGVGYIGAGECVTCHEFKSIGQEEVEKYLESKHVVHSTHITQASDAYCLECHDATNAGPTLEEFLSADVIPAEGLAAVSCEDCHGAGADHLAGQGLPMRIPDFEVCGNCHNELPSSHIPHHPFADNILDNYKASGHAASINSHVQEADGEPVRARCSMCHTDEGFREYASLYSGLGHDELVSAMEFEPELTDVSPVQCRTCHDSHSGELRAEATIVTVNDTLDSEGEALEAAEELTVTAYSAQFNLCTSCHQVFVTETFNEVSNKFEYALDDSVYDDPALIEYHNPETNPYGALGEIISDTHFAGTAADGSMVAGYNINAADENACLNCHDAHGATKFEQPFAAGIGAEWANEEGFHGDYQAEAFNHGFDETDGACMECHHGTEAVKVFEGQTADGLEGQPARVVACVTCHDLTAKDDAGEEFELGHLRQFKDGDGNVTETFEFPSGKTVTGVEENAICMNCHSGRSSKADVDNATPGSNGTYRFVNIHYRAAGASLFGNMAQGGYEFDGKAYAGKFEHMPSNDLCVECHNAHDGKLFIESPGFGPVGCNLCHSNIDIDPATDYEGAVAQVRDIRMPGSQADYDGDGDATEGLYYEVDTLKDELEAALVADGVELLGGYPYFGNITTMAQLQAAYNLQVASKDTGSWAHNPAYTIQLLVDSLEVLGYTTNSTTDNPYVRDDAGHFDASGEAFRHWDEDGEVSTSCAACHSSDGADAFFKNGEVTEEDFAEYTGGIASGLACYACHTGPTDFTAPVHTLESVTFPSGVTLDETSAAAYFADDSPICMSCHQGRSSGADVDEAIAGGSFRFVNIHYYAAAASVFGSDVGGGYEYAGKTYAGETNWPGAHNGSGFNTCAGCHMSDSPAHDFKPDLASCTGCHGGTSFETMGIGVSSNYDDIETLKGELLPLLTASGVTKLDGYPYFSNITTGPQLRAAYNWQVADKEPCGYIHNGDYLKQLLYDSIEAMGGTPSVTRP